jgi:small-conductance mechanosensitive channel
MDSLSAEQIYSFFLKLISTPIFSVKETPITIISVLILIGMMVGVIYLAKLTKKILIKNILPKAQMDIGTQYTLARISQYSVVSLGSIFAFQFIGIDLSGLTVIFGLLSVGIGFGLQNLTSNFVSGIIVLFERPISVGDRVLINGIEGDVSEINIRSTKIQSVNNISYIVPNADFVSNTIVNYSHGDSRIKIDIEVGVSYNSDVENVKNALHEVAKENNEVLLTPKPEIFLTKFGDSSWDMMLRIWIPDGKRRMQVTSDLNFAIVDKFRKYAIEIPFPQRDLWFRNSNPSS